MAYEVSKTVEFLTKHTTLISPPCYFSVKEIKHEACKGESEGSPEVVFIMSQEVFCRHEDRKGAANTIHNGDHVRQTEIPTFLRNEIVRIGWETDRNQGIE